jgi:regulator of sigma E protease
LTAGKGCIPKDSWTQSTLSTISQSRKKGLVKPIQTRQPQDTLSATMISLIYLFMTLMVISLIIIVHEYGHFLMARAFNVPVLSFSIGFGKPIWSKCSKKNTLFQIAPFLLGGYVQLLDTRDQIDPTDNKLNKQAFNNQSLWKRITILLAGPIMNIFLATCLFFISHSLGFYQIKPVISDIIPQSIAAKEQLPKNYLIKQFNGESINSWTDFMFRLIEEYGESKSIHLQLQSNTTPTKIVNKTLNLKNWVMKPPFNLLKSLGIIPFFPSQPVTLKSVSPDSPALRAGLRAGDTILTINRNPIPNWEILSEFLKQHPNAALTLTIKRPNIKKPLIIQAHSSWKLDKSWHLIGYLGINSQETVWPKGSRYFLKESGLTGLTLAWQMTVLHLHHHLIVFKKLLTGVIPVSALTGPMGILQHTHFALQQTISKACFFIGFINIAIAFINLLPIPMLDGGQIMLNVLESIRKKPFSIRMLQLLNHLSLIILVLIVIHALTNDISRTFGKRPAIKFVGK